MRFCQILTFTPAEHVVALARHAEAVGFDSVAFSDHVVYPLGVHHELPVLGGWHAHVHPESPWLDPLVAIAACATATERLRFITNVYVLGYRHPIAAAKQVASTDFLPADVCRSGSAPGGCARSSRRSTSPSSAVGLAWSRPSRSSASSGRAARSSTTASSTTSGPSRCLRPPIAPIPILIGGHTDRAMHRAATIGDGWLGLDYEVDELRAHPQSPARPPRRGRT